jgi:hypothetical protein
MPKKALKTPDSSEELESELVLDPDSLEAVLARVIGPLHARLSRLSRLSV